MAASSPPPTKVAARQVAPQTRSFATPLFVGELRNDGAALTRLQLLKFADHVPTRQDKAAQTSPPPLSLVSREPQDAPEPQALLHFEAGERVAIALRFRDAPFKEAGNDTALVLEGEGDTLAVRVDVRPRQDAYALDYQVALRNLSQVALPVGAKVSLALSTDDQDEQGGLLSGKAPGSGLRAVCAHDGSIDREDLAALKKHPFAKAGNVTFAALDRQYFVVAALRRDGAGRGCELSSDHKVIRAIVDLGGTTLAPQASWQTNFTVYAGPKLDEEFGRIAPSLQDLTEYNMWGLPLGALARPMVALLDTFHGWTSSWGLAIVLLTVLVKLVLLPLAYRGVVSMRKMQLLKPELDKIRGKYPNDRERQSMEQMKLYKERGINPLGGCLPMLLQLPVGLALYRMLSSAVHLYHQPFLWLPDLTAKEPYPVLAVLLGGITVAQQRLTPMNMEASQAKMFTYVMPLMLTFLMVNLPSGLVLYIMVNSILTIVQQLVINSRAASTS
ncbi:MAG: membrane protein insertase YidC [Deltaproteobacteria bacterium]|nr:MAG: membrane protein insertase YidC [Deltaproteobacteria bacterium]